MSQPIGDTIFLRELKVDTVIGIWDWERKIRQNVIIDLEMSADIAKAAATERIGNSSIIEAARSGGTSTPFKAEKRARRSAIGSPPSTRSFS